MILLHCVDQHAAGGRAAWLHQGDVEDIDTLIANMEKALETEGISRPRSYEVIEVEVKRRVVVEREIKQQVIVNISEGEVA